MKSRRAHSPHLPHGGTIDMRDRTNSRFGFIIDGGVANASGLAFVPDARFKDVRIAYTDSSWGIGVTLAERSRISALGIQHDQYRTVEALAGHDLQQVVAISHRVLLDPTVSAGGIDSLTIGIQPYGACERLLTATSDLAAINEFVQGVFMRDEPALSDPALTAEGVAARGFARCLLLVEATTYRVDPASTGSEHAIAQLLRSIPDVVSPLASCTCRATQAVPIEECAG